MDLMYVTLKIYKIYFHYKYKILIKNYSFSAQKNLLNFSIKNKQFW
jgi:hypothetical protein